MLSGARRLLFRRCADARASTCSIPRKYNRLIVQTSRGCPLRCEFCASSILLTRRYKQKPIEQGARRNRSHPILWRRPFIEFADDNAFVNRRYWKQLLPELTKRKIRWFAETDLSVHEDAELLRLMRASGCAEVLIGFESPGESGLRGLELKRDWKLRRWRDSKEAVRRIQSPASASTVASSSGSTARARRSLTGCCEFAMETELFDVQITGSDAVSRHAALLTSEARGSAAPRRRLGDVHSLRRQFPPAADVARRIASGFHRPG